MHINDQEKIITNQETGTTLKKPWVTPDFLLLDTDTVRGGHVLNVHEAMTTSSLHQHGILS